MKKYLSLFWIKLTIIVLAIIVNCDCGFSMNHYQYPDTIYHQYSDTTYNLKKDLGAKKDTVVKKRVEPSNVKTVANDSLAKTLQELVVTREVVQDDGMTKTYLITKDMLTKSFNTATLLDQLPGINVDLQNNDITYLGRNKVIILVDSIEKSESHIKRLNPKRFEKVEVTPMPTGRYAGYDLLINLKLKPAYTGSELQLTNYDNVNPNYLTKEKVNCLNQSALFDYMRNGWNFYVNADYVWVHGEESDSYDTHYLLEGITEKSLPNPKDMPTARSYERDGRISLNVDYKISEHHIIGALYNLGISNSDTYTRQTYSHSQSGSSSTETFTANNSLCTDRTSHLAGIFYEGRNLKGWNIGAKIHTYLDHAKSDNSYHRSSGYDQIYKTRPAMNYTFMGINAGRKFFKNFGLNLDYSYINRNRQIKDLNGQSLSKLKEHRQYAGIGLDYSLGYRTSLSVGGWYLHDDVRSSDDQTYVNEFGFRFTGRHMFNDRFYALLNYTSTTSAPTSTQLSDYGQFVNPYLFVGGNPELKVANLNYLTADIGLFKYFTLSGSYIYFKNYIGEITTEKHGVRPDGTTGNFIVEQPVNYDRWEKSLKLTFEKNIKYVNLEVSGGYHHVSSSYRQESMRKGFWKWSANLSYFCMPLTMNMKLSYEVPLIYRIVSPQTWNRDTSDTFRLNLSKSFINGKLFVIADYRLPLHIYSNQQSSGTSSHVMVSNNVSRTPHLEDNRLWVMITYMFNSGQRINRLKKEMHQEE